MVNLSEILHALSKPDIPLVKVLHKCHTSEIIILAFKKGMKLPKHLTQIPAQLWILRGKIKYLQENTSEILDEMDVKEIPINVYHEVHALEESYCLLVKEMVKENNL
jgi:quercetin dioxygenase-like cupin family protein